MEVGREEVDVGRLRALFAAEGRSLCDFCGNFETHSPDKGGDCDMGVEGSVLDKGELDREDCIEDDGGEEDMGVDESEGGC